MTSEEKPPEGSDAQKAERADNVIDLKGERALRELFEVIRDKSLARQLIEDAKRLRNDPNAPPAGVSPSELYAFAQNPFNFKNEKPDRYQLVLQTLRTNPHMRELFERMAKAAKLIREPQDEPER